MTGGSVEGPAIFFDKQGVKTEVPGRQNLTAVGQFVAPDSAKNRSIAIPGRALVQSNEAGYGLITGQDMIAGTYPNWTAPAAKQNMADIALKDGTLSSTSTVLRDARLRNWIAQEKVIPLPTQDGIRLLWLDTSDAAGIRDFRKLARDLASHHGTDEAVLSENAGFAAWNKWNEPEGQVGQTYARMVRGSDLADAAGNVSPRPAPPPKYKPGAYTGLEARLIQNFNAVRPGQAARAIELDEAASRAFGVPVSQVLQELRRAIRDSGFAGVEAMAKKLGALLGVMLAAASYLMRNPEAGFRRVSSS